MAALAARADHDEIFDFSVAEGAERRNHGPITSGPVHTRKVATAAGSGTTVHAHLTSCAARCP